jgi:ubiquinone/menaquinone biosynthesis C-methylase UbiE
LETEHQPARKAHPAFLVADLEAMRARIEASGMGVQFDVAIPGYHRFETHDPFGNRLEFTQYVRLPSDADGSAEHDAIKVRVREQFARTAAAYVESAGHARGDDLARLVELAAPRSSDRALDVATGGGHTALALAPHVAAVMVTDLTPTMLATARNHLSGNGVVNADYVVADAERLPFLDASFDLVTVRIAPHHFADIRAACGELARVLRPDGRLVMIDNVAPEDSALDAFVNEIEMRRDPSHVRCYTPSEWEGFLDAAGLTVTHAEVKRKTHDFADWTARARMLDVECDALTRDMLAAPAAAREHFAIKGEGGYVLSWSSEFIILRATKPA